VHEGKDVDLFELPILRTWPLDAGPVVTLPLVFTQDPVTGARNCGMYRLQRYDKQTLGFHVHTHHTGAEHLRKYAALGRDAMPVAIAVGASAATVFAAVAPLPPGVDELLFAAFLQGCPVDLVRCRTVPLDVPAQAEFVIEGWVPVDERRTEGPFGDHTGFYSLPDEYGVLHVSAITHRKDAIWHTTVVGPPPQEDCWMGAAIERLFLPLQRKLMPELLDMRLPFAGVFHNLMLLKIRKEYPGQARKVAHTVWGLGQAMFTKVGRGLRPGRARAHRRRGAARAAPVAPRRVARSRVRAGAHRDARSCQPRAALRQQGLDRPDGQPARRGRAPQRPRPGPGRRGGGGRARGDGLDAGRSTPSACWPACAASPASSAPA
jgi:hypothetical protein